MENKLFQETPENEREAMLEANCIRPEEKTIQKYFTPDEMIQMRADYSMNAIVIRKATEKLNQAKDLWKVETKPQLDENEYLINNIRHGFQEVDMQVYLFADFEAGMVGYYDNTGTLIESRRMRPEERQMYIKSNN